MSSVKYNLKIANCNILTYRNTGAEWESYWRRRPTLRCFPNRNLSSSIFYDAPRAGWPQISFILQTVVVVITLHLTVLGLNHSSAAPGIFIPMESQKSGAVWNMEALGLLFTAPFPWLWCLFHLRKGSLTWGKTLKFLFLIEKWHWCHCCWSANVIAKYAAWVFPWWKTREQKEEEMAWYTSRWLSWDTFLYVFQEKRRKKGRLWTLREGYGLWSFSGY